VVTASTFAAAREKLSAETSQPALFVLDLYFPDASASAGSDVISEPPVALIDDEGDLIKAYFNVAAANRRYQAIRIARGQGPEGGLQLIADVQRHYPGIPIVTYTRKGTIEEAERARKAGARRVLQKPSGADWDATYRYTKAKKTELESEFNSVITLDPFELLTLIVHYAHLLADRDESKAIAAAIFDVRSKMLKSGLREAAEEDVDALMDLTRHPFIRSLIYQLRPGAFERKPETGVGASDEE
jgi:DNA-binding NarL/FixJ family response regulator